MGQVSPTFFRAIFITSTSFSSSSTSKIARVMTLLKFQPKPASLAQLGFKIDLPTHALDRLAHNSQADAGAFIFSGGVNPLEHPENPCIIFRRDAHAVVLEIYPHMGIARL